MKKTIKILTLFLMTMLLAMITIAQEEKAQENTIESVLSEIDLTNLPGSVKFILGKPNINVNVIDVESKIKQTYGFKIGENKIKEFKDEAIDNPNFIIALKEDVFDNVVNSVDPMKEIKELYANKDISIEAVTLGSKIKLAIVNFFI
jgi:hypothetical protein